MAPYANYTYYTDTYKGNAIAEADFDRLVMRAGSFLDRESNGRASSWPDTEAVKMAACAVAEAWLINEQGGEIVSQSVGSWSRTFATKGKSDEERLFAAGRFYLPELIRSVRWC